MADKISVDRIDQMLRVVFQELKSMGGRAGVKDLLAAVEPKLKLTDYEKGATQTGATRWSVHIGFYTGDCVGSGFLVKGGKQWTLTPEGEKALKLPPGELIRTAQRDCAVSENALGDQGKNGGDDTQDQAGRLAEYDLTKEAARAEIRDELFGSPWNHSLQWDFEFPDLESWHICPGFIDPMADKLEEWTCNLDHTVEDFQKLAHFADHLEREGDCASIAAWDRATVWLDVNVSVDFRETFERKVKAVAGKTREFLVRLSRWYLEGDPERWDGNSESSYAIATFEQNVCDKHLRYLRNTSQTLDRMVTEQGEAGAAMDTGHGDGIKQITDLRMRLRKLEKHVRKPKSKREQINEQRVKFCRPWVEKGEPWSTIYRAYYKKYPEDKKASKGALRLTWGRYGHKY